MQRHTLLTLCAAAVFATSALGVATARAAKPASLIASMTWKGTTSRDWNTAGNWSGSTVPVAGDIVTIPLTEPEGYQGDPIISNADGLAGDLTIDRTRTVTVTGKKLTLDGAVTHDFKGDLFLTNGSSILKFVDNSATVNGAGAIVGQDNGAKIQIEGGDTLTSTMLIQGQLIIETNGGTGNGTFNNGATGILRADADGGGSDAILLLASGLTLDDDDGGGAKWQAQDDADAVLRFDVGACLDGDFLIDDCATLRINGVDVATQGDVTQTAGTIDLPSSGTLAKNCNSDCTNCTSVSAGTNGGC